MQENGPIAEKGDDRENEGTRITRVQTGERNQTSPASLRATFSQLVNRF